MLNKIRLLLFMLILATASYAEIFSYNFEGGCRIEQFREFDLEGVAAEIKTDKLDRRHVSVKNQKPSRYCRLRIRKPFIFDESLSLSFKAKAIAKGSGIDYLAIGLFNDGENYFFGREKISSDFREIKFYFSQIRQVKDYSVKKLKIEYIDIYIRATNPAQLNMVLDDIRLGQDILTTVSYNSPPFFNWDKIGRSVLQYSEDIQFKTDTVTVETDYNFYTPAYKLSAGKWYWRVRPADSEKWGAVRCIEIASRHHSYIAETVDYISLEKKPRPRLPVSAELAAKERKELRDEFLELREYKIPQDTPSLADSNMERWQWYSKVKRMTVMPSGKNLQKMAELYVSLGSDDVREVLTGWVWKITKWDPKGGSSPSGGDIPAYHILRGLNNSYDALYNDLSKQQRQELKEAIITRALDFEELLGNPFPVNTKKEYNNHAWLQALVLCETGMALIGEYEKAEEWIEYTKQLMTGLFLCGLGFQGESNEGLSYWGYGEKFLQRYASLLRAVTGNNLFDHPWLKNAAKFPIYCAPKNAWGVSFADIGRPNHGYKAVPEQEGQFQAIYNNVNNLTKKLARECKDPYALWYCRDYSNQDTLPKPPVDLGPSIHYEHIGWAIQNTDLVDGSEGVTVAMRSGPYWSAHQHEDQNGFVINAYGDKIAIDSGYYDFYGSEHFLEYSIRSKAHNVLLVNGKGQDSKKPGADGRIVDYFSSPSYGLISADGSNQSMYEGQLKKWMRHILFIKPKYIIIYDELKSKLPARYDWLLHSVNKYSLNTGTNEFSFNTSNASLKGKFLLPSDVAITQKKGYPVLPEGLDDSPIKPEDVVEEWTLNACVEDKDILTVLQICRLENDDKELELQKIEASENVEAFCIKNKAQQNIVILNKKGKNIGISNIETDAVHCILTFDENDLLKGFFINAGSYLKYKEAELFRLADDDSKANISAEIKPDLTVYKISVENEDYIHLDSEKEHFFSKKGWLEYESDKGIRIKDSQIIAEGAKAEEYFQRELPPLQWAEVELMGYSPYYVNSRNYWWGRIWVDHDSKLQVSSSADDVKIFIDDYQLLANGTDTMSIDKGYHFVQVSSKIKNINLKVDYE